MRRNTTLFRLATMTAIGALAAAVALPAGALAQDDAALLAEAAQETVNPPARVGALTLVNGTVSFRSAGADSWTAAALNFPVTEGNALWTEPGAQTAISVSDTRIVLNESTELDVVSFGDQAFVANLPQGEAYVRVRSLQPGETYSLVTPRASVNISAPGRYVVLAGTTDAPTQVTVLEGEATITDGVDDHVTAGQTAQITGNQAPYQMQTLTAAQDAFVSQLIAQEQAVQVGTAPVSGGTIRTETVTTTVSGGTVSGGESAQVVAVQAEAPPPVVESMPGGADLAQYGAWQSTPQYGEVWYPQVQQGWVPYRDGHWAYVRPWGWTWVDNARWGFAPFHYGRWVQVSGRWGWTPGAPQPVVPDAPVTPVYAPALVTFFGVGAVAAGVAVGVTAGLLASGSVGWVPLAPHEPYRPWFHASPTYVRNVNVRNVSNVTQLTNVVNSTTNVTNTSVNNVTINHFANARAATLVPAAAMATSRPVAQVRQPVTQQVLAQSRPVVNRPIVPPTTATLGVTPAVAKSVNAVPAPKGIAPNPPVSPAPPKAVAFQQLRQQVRPNGVQHPAGLTAVQPGQPVQATVGKPQVGQPAPGKTAVAPTAPGGIAPAPHPAALPTTPGGIAPAPHLAALPAAPGGIAPAPHPAALPTAPGSHPAGTHPATAPAPHPAGTPLALSGQHTTAPATTPAPHPAVAPANPAEHHTATAPAPHPATAHPTAPVQHLATPTTVPAPHPATFQASPPNHPATAPAPQAHAAAAPAPHPAAQMAPAHPAPPPVPHPMPAAAHPPAPAPAVHPVPAVTHVPPPAQHPAPHPQPEPQKKPNGQ